MEEIRKHQNDQMQELFIKDSSIGAQPTQFYEEDVEGIIDGFEKSCEIEKDYEQVETDMGVELENKSKSSIEIKIYNILKDEKETYNKKRKPSDESNSISEDGSYKDTPDHSILLDRINELERRIDAMREEIDELKSTMSK